MYVLDQPSCKCHALRDIALLDTYSNLFYGQLQKMTHQALIFDLISQWNFFFSELTWYVRLGNIYGKDYMKKLAKSSWVCGSSWCGDLVGLLIGIDQG